MYDSDSQSLLLNLLTFYYFGKYLLGVNKNLSSIYHDTIWGINCITKTLSGVLYLIIQFSSVAQSCPTLVTPWTAARQASLSIINSQSLLKLMSIESVMPFSHLILCHPLLLPLSIFPSIRVFSNESALRMRWPKYWSLSLSISPSNEYSGLISFKVDWLDLLAVQGTF